MGRAGRSYYQERTMNSKQRRLRRRIASSIESQVRSEFSQKISTLDKTAKIAEAENRELRKVRTEYARELYPAPHCFDISRPSSAVSLPRNASKTVYVEMVRYAVSIPYDRLYGNDDPPINLYKEQAVRAIYEEFRKRAITGADQFRDDRGEVYTLSIVLPVAG
jgi:hypothetical protein